MSASVQRKLREAHHALSRGDPATACALCEDVLARAPRNPDALWLFGTARLMRGEAQQAVGLLERAAAAAPARGAVLESLGLAHLMSGNPAAAEDALRRALACAGAPPSVRMRLGIALLQQGRSDEAASALERALADDPRDTAARLNLGRAYAAQGSWHEAAREFERVLAHEPANADATYNLGVALSECGEPERARACFERVLAGDAANLDALERLASIQLTLGRYGEALRHLRALALARPADAALHVALANAAFQTGAVDEALEIVEQALAIDAAAGGAHALKALIEYVRGELDRSIDTLDEGFARTGELPLLGSLVHLAHRTCDWRRWREAWMRLQPHIDTADDLGSPFWLLSEETTPQQQLAYSRRWAAARFARVKAARAAARRPRAGDRLRIGYFSSDFQDHAVGHLVVETLELHDRDRFEIFLYSYGPADGSEVRARLTASVEHFADVAWEPDDVVVERMRRDRLDVLVDLKGYTVGDRLGVMARRPSPLQVTWLGYPATTGADFIDYVIADEFIIPREAEAHYSERVLRMPLCYQPRDRRRTVQPTRARSEYGLPEHAFVFCCFNQAVKIMPEVFARWMRLLRALPSSVLWILEENRWAMENLRHAAADAGIDPGRLLIAKRLPNAEHLARFGAADLALDTFPYTSHTTASDALWMGCPLVALCGDTFAARVSGSVLSSCGLGDLVTHTLDEYEALAYRLATDSAHMRELRTRIAAAKHAPAFDSEKFARDLEALYLQIAG